MLCMFKDFCNNLGTNIHVHVAVLRGLEPADLAAFDFRHLFDEWKSCAPIILQFLCSVANKQVSVSKENCAGICTAGAVLLRERNIHMSAMHHIAGLILFHGNASKMVGHQLYFLKI